MGKKIGEKNETLMKCLTVWHSMTRKSIQKFYLSKSQKLTARDWVSPTLTLWFHVFSDLDFNAMTTVSLYLFWNFRLFIFGWNSHVIVLCRQCSFLKWALWNLHYAHLWETYLNFQVWATIFINTICCLAKNASTIQQK